MSKDTKPKARAKMGAAKAKTTTRVPVKQPESSKNVSAPYTTTITIDGQVYEQRYYEPMHGYDKYKTKKIIVIAFADDNRILGIKNRSRVDILHGERTWEDDTYEDAARREAKEEGNVTVDKISQAAVIASSPKGEPEQITHTLVMTARIKSVDPYQPWHGTHKRVLLTKKNLLHKFSANKAKDLTQLINMAEFALSDPPEADAPMVVDHMRYIMENL